ncbi:MULTISPECIES: flagellar biosynthesis protein FlhF [Bacillus]|uniref:Flagellar biosynthesis protein FlhF n=2 Tax=Bacillus TaxID=1386 RepID=A0A0M4FPW9_9BACI|nr:MULTISPECIES: flagellar biosynthesis protein FlhF [Bacillus]ALC81071.1 hypothetical protein AM592_05295 [Bacillus gobiensis]MBP1080032.1 flagellar biosynthesis protein FlhF [Bacillus capparidis]MED1095421.1 flagellar biosynthesis protein FlhF [Bacillus capparidis]
MRIKKFTADTMNSAAKIIKQELGNDAVILNSKTVYKRKLFGLTKKKAVEVIAVADQSGLDVTAPQEKKALRTLKPGPSPAPVSETEQKPIRQMVHSPIDKTRYELFPDHVRQISNLLLNQGVSSEIHHQIMLPLIELALKNEWPEKPRLLDIIGQELSCLIDDYKGFNDQTKYIALFGPTGVGKTTTLAKLAADSFLNKQKRIAFITTDTYRIAAVEQLKTYAELLSAPLEVCYSKEDFQKAQQKLSEYDHVFIDTAGRNYKETQFIKELEQLIPFGDDIESYLVLSATSKQEDLLQISRQFAHLPFCRYIMTKLDETDTLGPVLTLLSETKTCIGYITDGQAVPEDIRKMNKSEFVQSLMRFL